MHLHFIFRLLGLYVLTPALRLLLQGVERRALAVAAAVLLAIGLANSLAESALASRPTVFLRFVPFLGYSRAGCLLRDVNVARRGALWCALGLLAFAGRGCAQLTIQSRVLKISKRM